MLKRNIITDYCMKRKMDIKGTWKIINSMIKGNKTNVSYPEEFYDKGQCIKNGKSIADGFNNFFTSVGPTLAANIKTPATAQSIFETMGMKNVNSMFVNPVTQVELFKIVNTCKAKHSCDVDDISVYIVKNTFKAIVTPFLHICNLSFSTGVFPDGMKVAKIVPLFKAGDKSSFTNYRPVSLLPQFSKILEKLFDTRLTNFVNKHHILSNTQYGFRNSRCTAMALLNFMENLGNASDKKLVTLGVFIDLKKAFDTIDHALLLDKLYHYGIRGMAGYWLKSYLLNRKQFVNVNGEKSDQLSVVCGVP